MALGSRRFSHLKPNNDTGFGTNPNSYGGRFINRDGTFNLRKEGIPVWERFSLFHSMLNLPIWKFFGLIFIFYLSVNFVFAFIYFFLGKQEFQGITSVTPGTIFKEMYFFSTETFTTVGYGRVNPVGDGANAVAAIESMAGFLSFAVATGLMYGRFSKPKAFLMFSREALISPYRGGSALMFRFAAYKDNHTLTNVEIKVNVALQVIENDSPVYRFYDLDLERSRVESLPMNWTVVHPITENSPIYGLDPDEMKKEDVEIYVLVRGFDDVYSNIVLQRTSYTYDEIVFNRKFVPMYRESENGRTTILELNKIDDYIVVEPVQIGHQT
jgi:inward rectifier potassium channel